MPLDAAFQTVGLESKYITYKSDHLHNIPLYYIPKLDSFLL